MSTRRKGRGGSKLFGRPDALLVEEGAAPTGSTSSLPEAPPAEPVRAQPPSEPPVAVEEEAVFVAPPIGGDAPADDEELIEAASGSGSGGMLAAEAERDAKVASIKDDVVVGAPLGGIGIRVLHTAHRAALDPRPSRTPPASPMVESDPGSGSLGDDDLAVRDIVETSRVGSRVDLSADEPEWDAGPMEALEADEEETTHGPLVDSPFAAVRLGVPGRPVDPIPPADAPSTNAVPAGSAPLPPPGGLDDPGRRLQEPTSTLPTELSPAVSPPWREAVAATPRPAPVPPRPAAGLPPGEVVPLPTARGPAVDAPVAASGAAAASPRSPSPSRDAPTSGMGAGAWVAVVAFLALGAAAAWYWGVPALRGRDRGAEVVAANPRTNAVAAASPPAEAPPAAAVPGPSSVDPAVATPPSAPPAETTPPAAATTPPPSPQPTAAAKAPTAPPPKRTTPSRSTEEPTTSTATSTAAPASATSSRLSTEDPAAARGLIRIKTDRKCLIMVDGKQRGYAPDLGTIELPAGTHVVRAIVQGTGQSRSIEVRVDAGLLRDVEIRWD